MPMWCSSSDTPRSTDGIPQPHHRIVRIPPGESVVLNSAERAPYLLLVEILNDDLDFDPAKRANKEVLKRIVAKENGQTGTSRDLISFNTSTAMQRQKSIQDPIIESDTGLTDEISENPNMVPPTPTSESGIPGEEEEIDLVEQLYGTNQPLRGPIDLSESIVLPPAPKNKELDMVAWSRPSSIPPSPLIESGTSFNTLPTPAFTPASSHLSLPASHHSTPRINDGPGSSVLSLDEYSERMRTAAVMLAQLNSNLVRESIMSIPGKPGNIDAQSPPSGSLSWIPGSSWLAGASNPVRPGGPVHPSLAGGPLENSGPSSSTTSSRMKVQHSEAAAIRDRIMKEMLALEEERMERMREHREGEGMMRIGDVGGGMKSEDEGIIRRELNRADPSAIVFSESWAAKKVGSGSLLTRMILIISSVSVESNTT
jgi:hypothetical protein